MISRLCGTVYCRNFESSGKFKKRLLIISMQKNVQGDQKFSSHVCLLDSWLLFFLNFFFFGSWKCLLEKRKTSCHVRHICFGGKYAVSLIVYEGLSLVLFSIRGCYNSPRSYLCMLLEHDKALQKGKKRGRGQKFCKSSSNEVRDKWNNVLSLCEPWRSIPQNKWIIGNMCHSFFFLCVFFFPNWHTFTHFG